MGSRTVVAVLQPSYLPWLGALEQVAKADVFVFYDDVQFDKNGWRNRNRIRTNSAEGWSWLTIPVRLEGHFPKLPQVRIDGRTPWRRKHEKTIRHEYARAAYLGELDEHFKGFFDSTDDRLVEVAIDSTVRLLKAFKITTPVVRSSALPATGDRNERLLSICEHLGATGYYSGASAMDYLDVEAFEARGIRVEFQRFEHPQYAQTRQPFVSHLSALDALLNVGSSARSLLGLAS